MSLEDILEKLMYLDEGVCPCEDGIPCPFYAPYEDYYCHNYNCIEGMAQLIKNIVKEKEK